MVALWDLIPAAVNKNKTESPRENKNKQLPTPRPSIADSVQRNGLRAEFIGSTRTAVQAYTSPGITWLFSANIPLKQNKKNTNYLNTKMPQI